MFKKFLSLGTVLLLGGCLTTSDTGSRVSGSSSSGGSHSSGGSSDRNHNNSSTKLNRISKIADLSKDIAEENKSRVTSAFKKYNENNSTGKISFTTENLEYADDILKNQSTVNNLAGLSSSYDTALSNLSKWSSTLSGVSQSLAGATQNLNSKKSSLSQNQTALDQTKTNLIAEEKKLDEYWRYYSDLKSEFISHPEYSSSEGMLKELARRKVLVDNSESTCSSYRNSISSYESTISSLNSEISSIQQDVDKYTSLKNEASAKVNQYTNEKTSLEGTISTEIQKFDANFSASKYGDALSTEIKNRVNIYSGYYIMSTRLANVKVLLDAYDEGKYTSGGTSYTRGSYYGNKALLNDYNKYLLGKKRSDFSSDKDYADWLSSNATSFSGNRASYTSDATYITAVQTAYFNWVKVLSGLENYAKSSYSADDYNAIMNALSSKRSSLADVVKTLEYVMVDALKKLDSTYTSDELPLTLSQYIAFFRNQKKILSAISGVDYIYDVTVHPEGTVSATSTGDESSKSVLTYDYNSAISDYILNFRETSKSGTNKNDTVVSFKASDFSASGKAYVATSTRTVSKTEDYYTFLSGVESYVYGGGVLDAEVESRRKYALSVFTRVQNGTATDAEKTVLKQWLGSNFSSDITSVAFSSLTDNEKLKFNLAMYMLGKEKPDFTVDKARIITDTVKLGGTVAGLTFSDFGIWSIKGMNKYTGDEQLLAKNLDGRFSSDTYHVQYPFISGMSQFKQGYASDSTLAAGKSVVFKGNALGVATLSGNNPNNTLVKDLSGSATLTVANDLQTKNGVSSIYGNLSVNFDNYYSFKFADINVASKSGFKSSNVSIESSSKVANIDKFQFGSSPTLSGSVTGQMYGLETNRPTEAVGMFDVSSKTIHNDPTNSTYSKLTVEGAFGVKK